MSKIILIIMISISIIKAHDLIDTSNINVNKYKCKKVVHWLKEPKKHDFYTNVDNYLVGVAYEQCNLNKKEFDNSFKFYALIKVDKKRKGISIENGETFYSYYEYIERYKIDLQSFLYYYSFKK